MGAVAHLNWEKVKSSKILRRLSRYYYAGRFDESGSSYFLDKKNDTRIVLSVTLTGSYSDPEDDDMLSEVINNEYTGTMSLWGRTTGRGYSTDDPDPWNYSYIELCFLNNELFAIVSDNAVIWSPYPFEHVVGIITSYQREFSYEIDLPKLRLATKTELSKLPFRKRPEITVGGSSIQPKLTYTVITPKAESDLMDAWVKHLGGMSNTSSDIKTDPDIAGAIIEAQVDEQCKEIVNPHTRALIGSDTVPLTTSLFPLDIIVKAINEKVSHVVLYLTDSFDNIQHIAYTVDAETKTVVFDELKTKRLADIGAGIQRAALHAGKTNFGLNVNMSLLMTELEGTLVYTPEL